jgi:SAM-dependent methyltransferase
MLRSTSPDAVAAYQSNAVKFVGILENALSAVGKSWADVERVLEIGCGYGRIVRVLREHVPPSKIYVSDVIDEAANFSAAELGVNKMPLLEKVQGGYDEFFDLIYMLGVYIHMPMDFMRKHIELVSKALKPSGLFVFTTQGPISAQNAEQYSQYWLDKKIVLQDLETNGYLFQKYPHYYDQYGMAWHTEDYVRETIQNAKIPLRFIRYGPAEYGGHSDVFVYSKDRIDSAVEGEQLPLLQSIDQKIGQLLSTDSDDLGRALKALKEGILSSSFAEQQCSELLEQVEALGQQATLPAEQRKKGIIKPLVDSLAGVCSGAGGLAVVWQTWGPAIGKFFGLTI